MLAADCFFEKNLTRFLCLSRLAEKAKREAVIQTGLEQTVWPGRMEIISTKPFLMVDGAHNGNGVEAFCKSLKALYPEEKFVFFMAVMADKDYELMVEQMLPIAKCFYTFTPESSRALQSTRLAAYINSRGVEAFVCEAYEDMLQKLEPDTKNIAFGSLYFIGTIKAIWKNERKRM
jgi:dihydrofolate synthase/folylpolyglutamate synthase